MNGVTKTARSSARVASRYAAFRYAPRRTFKTSLRQREAQNYTMPALSPTMTEGNISSWKIKEGDSFTAGDVVLEIETDKATMDVEAQDDGVLFKIMHGDGSKGIKIGERIAVLAEEGDDLGNLEIPEEDRSKIQSQSQSQEQEKNQSTTETKEESTSSQQAKEESGRQDETTSVDRQPGSPPKQESTVSTGSKPQSHTSPLFPSVQQLLHRNGYSIGDVQKITGSGPNGRVLKGDVLAYIGRISKEYPAKEAERIKKQSHLDLANVTPSTPRPETKKEQREPATAATEPELPTETEIAVPISLSSVIATQKRVQDSLGIFLPLSTFIARASELANEDLPARKGTKPSADDLFNSVLGLDKVATRSSSRGHFVPQITGISPPVPAVPVRRPDIIDMLAPEAAKAKIPKVPAVPPAAVGISADGNIFRVVARVGEEARATEYLEKMKLALEKEPGRLVL